MEDEFMMDCQYDRLTIACWAFVLGMVFGILVATGGF